jgi:hypothetical protein
VGLVVQVNCIINNSLKWAFKAANTGMFQAETIHKRDDSCITVPIKNRLAHSIQIFPSTKICLRIGLKSFFFLKACHICHPPPPPPQRPNPPAVGGTRLWWYQAVKGLTQNSLCSCSTSSRRGERHFSTYFCIFPKVGGPQIISANRKSANFRTYIFVRFTDFAVLCTLRFADPI